MPISRSRLSVKAQESLLCSYARQETPSEAAHRAKVSRNTAYEFYKRVRWRLIDVQYYRDAAQSKDEAGLASHHMAEIRRRRGLTLPDVFEHSAEIIFWSEGWPSGLVLRQIRRIIELSGPLDVEPSLGDMRKQALNAYVVYAKAKLILVRLENLKRADQHHFDRVSRTSTAVASYLRTYRSKRRAMLRAEKDELVLISRLERRARRKI